MGRPQLELLVPASDHGCVCWAPCFRIPLDRPSLERAKVVGLDLHRSAAGARALLSTVGGSVITVAGVVFSITIAALTQASSQFGPRLLRNFMRDVGNQFVLGTFVATFFYCLLILRAVRGADDSSFVPNLSITVAVLMAAGSLAVLIYFIDHISRSLQGPQVVAAVGIELERAVSRPFPTGVAEASENESEISTDWDGADLEKGYNVAATDNGYLQAMNENGLLEIAKAAMIGSSASLVDPGTTS